MSDTVYEVKDVQNLSNTKQIQAQMEYAKKNGLNYKIITGTNTHVSGNIPNEYIIRLDYLGPQQCPSMGHFDRKNYIISVKLRESCSDKRFIDWQLERDYSYTIDEVKAFENSILPHYNTLAEKIVRFFIEYEKGSITPNKWNTFEPIKHDFTISKINEYIGILAYPAGHLYLKRNKKYSCYIDNCDFGFWWFGGKPCRPKVSFEFLVEIKIFFSKQSKPMMEFMKQLADDMAEYFDTDYAKIIDQEMASEMPPLYEKDPRAVIYDAVAE